MNPFSAQYNRYKALKKKLKKLVLSPNPDREAILTAITEYHLDTAFSSLSADYRAALSTAFTAGLTIGLRGPIGLPGPAVALSFPHKDGP